MQGGLRCFVVLLGVIYGVAEKKIAKQRNANFAILILWVWMGT
jgi:hypothetical protein